LTLRAGRFGLNVGRIYNDQSVQNRLNQINSQIGKQEKYQSDKNFEIQLQAPDLHPIAFV
jgi:hypothetical protein